MTRTLTLAAALSAISLAPLAEARPSSHSELRGLENCMDAAADEGMETNPGRTYYIQKEDGENNYFINGFAWQNGDRVPLRIACTTSSNGRQLVSLDFAEGRYSNRSRGVAIANN